MAAPEILLAYAADQVLGDPQRGHPVALFGRWAQALEKRMYRDSRLAGAAFACASITPAVLAAWQLERSFPRVTMAAALWASLGGRTLTRTALALAEDLDAGRVEDARAWIPWLCSRDPKSLDAPGMARACVESVAENTLDAAIAPFVWAAVGGAPAVVGHRLINTLDAMVGYRNERYRKFGWAAARADDLLAWAPARITAAIHLGIAAVLGRGGEAARAWREDAPHHPSPNAGPVEATAAAVLGVQLGGATVYPHGVEQRPVLGLGAAPTSATIRSAARLSTATQAITALAAAALARRR